jgi:hypothetical protein
VTALHVSFSDWAAVRNFVPPNPREFQQLLLELGCEIGTVGREQLVLGVGLKEDVEAQRSFDDSCLDGGV